MLDNLSHKQKIILLGLSVFVILEVALFIVGNVDFGNGDVADRPDQNGQDTPTSVTTTEEEIPEMTTEVPDNATETQAREEVDIDNQQGESTGAKLGIYDVTASSDGFSPSELVVSRGDTVQLEFTAEGEQLDFSIPAYGVHISSNEGETSQLSFTASATGTFRIECRDHCPESGKIVGRFIVKSQE